MRGTISAVSVRYATALRVSALTPDPASLLADAVNESRSPLASTQGTTVAQTHFMLERRWRNRTRLHTLLDPVHEAFDRTLRLGMVIAD